MFIWAAGFQLNANQQPASAVLSLRCSNADNASVMARNPAAMAPFDKTSSYLCFESITSMIDVKDAEYKSL
ncbi:outer membrane protein transport protein [Vibrio lentus]|nr:outer membrane protein transport protein [Vibrio lentus]